ncbi:MAG: ankyrin repeat domain-containing protein, partial [Oceanococcaceae bacterium]
RDPAGFALREMGESLLHDHIRRRPLDPAKVNRMHALLAEVEDIDALDQAHRPVLWYAAAIGDLSLIDAITDRGATLDDPDMFDVPPLYEAVRRGHTNAVARLVEAGADPDAVGRGNVPALVVASESGNLAMVVVLIDGGAAVNQEPVGGAALAAVLRSGHVAVVERLLAAGAPLTPVLGMHPAAWAYRQDDPALFRFLATHTDALSTHVGPHDPPAFAAVANCALEPFFDFVEWGTNPNARNTRGESLAVYLLTYRFQRCPQIEAQRPDVISLFIEKGLDLEATDAHGRPLVLIALHYDRVESARRLIAAGAPLDGWYGQKDILILAAGRGANDLIDVALDRGMDINVRSEGLNTDTPLYEAAREGRLDTVKHLLSRGAEMPDTAIGLRRMYGAAGKYPPLFGYLLDRYIAQGRTTEHDQMLRRGARDSKNQQSLAMLDELDIP